MTQQPGGQDGYSGQMGLADPLSESNAIAFMIWSMLGQVRTMTIVKVAAVDAQAMTVDVQPMVNQVDGVGNSTPHGLVLGLPYMTIQAGANAVRMTPVVGDVGVAIISDRDISSVKASRGQATPGSKRRFSLSDGVYVGGFLNGAPDQLVEFTEDGISISDKHGNKIESSAAGWTITGDLAVTGEVTKGSGASKVTLSQHFHPGNNQPPTPGH